MPDWTSRQAEGGVPADASFVTVNAEGDLTGEQLLSALALMKANNLSDVANAATTRSNIGAGTGNGDLLAANNLSDLTTAATARTNLGLGTAATLDVGTGANNIVQLDVDSKLPAVNGSLLTNLPAGVAGSDGQMQYNNDGAIGGAANVFYDDVNGNLGVGLSSFGTSGTKVLGLGVGVIPSTSPADGVQVYAEDVTQIANLTLLAHFDGADGATSFPDSGPTGHTVTPVGNAQVDTAQSKFSGACGLLDGTGDYWTVADHANWDFGTGDFTIGFWVRFNSVGATICLFENGNYGSSTGILIQYSSGWLQVYILGGSADWSGSWSPSANTWYHIEVSRDGTNLRGFVDGVQLAGAATNSENIATSEGLTIGARNNASSPVNGWIEELIVLTGRALHTANFTPETSAYVAGDLAEFKVRDEAGNVTTLSPHNFSLIPKGPSEEMAWSHYSERNGKKLNVDMLKLARWVEKLSGDKLVYLE